MPAATADEPASPVLEKKSKKDKSKKKRSREEEGEDGVEVETPRKHKRSKSDLGAASVEEIHEAVAEPSPVKKHKKSKKSDGETTAAEQTDQSSEVKTKKPKKEKRKDAGMEDAAKVDADGETTSTEQRSKKERKHKKDKDESDDEAAAALGEELSVKTPPKKKSKDKKKKHDTPPPADEMEVDTAAEPEADPLAEDSMDVDVTPKRVAKSSVRAPTDAPANPPFPFYTQTISLYLPLYPVGFHEPISQAVQQHLAPQLNHYSPLVKGVLLGYRNACIAERPIRGNPRNPPTDKTPAVLHSIDEYAVGFGWLTADIDLFVPTRGAWMEGVVNLQSEGHIGVVCWDKFNASVEAKRLPAGWRWIDLTNGETAAEAAEEEDILDDENLQVAPQQMHATGYWVDASGRRVAGRLHFRIKNFDVGLAGEYGYLSIEGTMLDEADEKTLAAEEREETRRRRLRVDATSSGYLSKSVRRVPEFSMTRFGREDEEESSAQRTVFSKSRPTTPDD